MKLVLLLFGIVMLGACGKVDTPKPVPPIVQPKPPPVTPVPPPVTPPPDATTFVVNGMAIEIQGSIKPGAKTTVKFCETAVKTAVGILERKD